MAEVFEIGTVRAEPGGRALGYIESVYLRDATRVRIPLVVLHGASPGPALWVGSTIHGDEIPGCEVIRRLVWERVDPKKLKGTLIAAPVQNPVAYLESSRHNHHDGINLNRVFPGDPRGTMTHRIAHDLFQAAMRADVVLDVHCNAPGAVNFVVVNPHGTSRHSEAQWELAEAFGLTIGVGRGAGTSGMLQDAILDAGKPALLVELSGGYLWEEPSVRAGVTGVLNVMKYLGMLDGPREPQTEVQVIPGRLNNRHYLKAETGGLVRPIKPLGSAVKTDEPVAAIHDLFGRELETIRSPIDGWVITYPLAGNRTVVSGDTVAFVFGTR